ncbi:hypothetical protein [Luteolibacter sp. LG18]|uniref:hypothetical protein n=1 Tax=Luteolibacter sp. LG18 TaxID=2819286 RepID=UPI002B293D89|nr:hypothetical protein llg_24810 [Luteolibacter sp. LG18]
MDPQHHDYTADPHLHASHPVEENKPSVWKKLGGGSLSISIIVHAILLAVGVVWIFQIIPATEQKVDFMPKGGGGGSPGVKEVSNKKQRATMTNPNTPRMAAKGVASTFTLPEPDAASSMSSVGSLSSGGLSGGLGGSGSGGGRGDGHGTGFGSGTGPGLGGGAGTMSPFGMVNPNANAMIGVFFDTKQDPKRKPTDMTPEKLRDVIKEFTNQGWNERSLENKYYKADQKLYQTRVYMPVMSANEAPKAFNCEKEVQPSRWLVIYRGDVVAPKSGKFRFVGAGDDVLAVRFNKKNIFDHGYTQGTTALYVPGKVDVLAGKKEDREVERIIRGGAMRVPVTLYKYDTTANWNNALGGVAVGPEFDVTAGSTYPIEILISEIPGGLFGAALMIQEEGATYQKASTGSPILPLFRTDGSLPDAKGKDNAPPFDSQGAVWKISPTSRRDI